MNQVVIENPIINSPFDEPTRHFRFTDEGITNEIVTGRRISSYFVPIARPKKKGKDKSLFETEWTQDRIEENELVNQIRAQVKLWRDRGYVGVTPTTGRLIAYWTNPNREKRLFFCQNEALETAIYITEVAKKYGDAWIENTLREKNDTSNPGLPRTAFKMATGSGKTVVMAMLIAWHTLNKRANPRRLQQHQRLQAGFRLYRRLGKTDWRADHRPGRATGALSQRRRPRRVAAPSEHDPGGQPAARIRRGDERRLQKDRRP